MSLIERNKYGANYIPDLEEFKQKVLNKTIIPHQVEFQPGPMKGNLCWLKCPYCYGGSAIDTGERLTEDVALQVIDSLASKGVNKVIFAGYCTDPLNCEYIENITYKALVNNMTVGFNTKLLRIKENFIGRVLLFSTPNSYISVSIDAGNNDSYNRVHGIKSAATSYDRVLANVKSVTKWESNLDITVSYLLNRVNGGFDEVQKFIRDFQMSGIKLIRFAFPQLPRNASRKVKSMIIARAYRDWYKKRLQNVIDEYTNGACPIILVDADDEYNITSPRTLPCLARWIYPTVGFDGWLYHCSQSSAPNFRKMALGNLAEHDFWELYYDYNITEEYFKDLEKNMKECGCKCDRKEHLTNGKWEGEW
jgi:MoaA/NifB/PqqE/SkfB family radical SAM enzyme